VKYCKSIPGVLGFALTLIAAATAADAPRLTFRFTTVNVPGATQTIPGGVNNSGVMVGQYFDNSGAAHGYILNGKKLTTLDDPNGTSSDAISVNPNGSIAVAGSYINSTGKQEGFLYKRGKFTDVPGPTGALVSSAFGINDKGEIVGFYEDSTRIVHGFLLKGKTYTTLDVPGATSTFAAGINGKGIIVLQWLDSKGAMESSLYNGKTYRTIDVPGAAASYVQNINAAGDAIFGWMDSSGIAHGALLHGGKYYKFDDPKAVQTYPGGINDRHLIVGAYQVKSNGPYQGFKATY